MMLPRYRGYTGTAEWSEEDQVFFGKLLGTEDLISYEAATHFDLENEFRVAVDEYIFLREGLDLS
jgi:predicted HicB family RNase H-like nuclease